MRGRAWTGSQMESKANEAQNLGGVCVFMKATNPVANQLYSRRNTITITINASWEERIR